MLPVFCLIVSVYLFAASCVRIKIIIKTSPALFLTYMEIAVMLGFTYAF